MTTKKYLAAAGTLRRHGINYLGTFVAGFDEDTHADIAGIADFAEKLGLFTIQIYARAVAPGTTDMILHGRRMIPGRLNKYANGHGAWILPSLMLPSQLQETIFNATLKFHQGVPSRAPARRVFSTIWDRLQPHQNALKRIEKDVLLPLGIYRQIKQGFHIDEDRLNRVCEEPDTYARYAAACSRIFRETEALGQAGFMVREAATSGKGALRTVM
jgi:hypothetical protein